MPSRDELFVNVRTIGQGAVKLRVPDIGGQSRPLATFRFSGHKQSFFGDLHTLGKDGCVLHRDEVHDLRLVHPGGLEEASGHLGRNPYPELGAPS